MERQLSRAVGQIRERCIVECPSHVKIRYRSRAGGQLSGCMARRHSADAVFTKAIRPAFLVV